jgi:hypothetical protein
MNDTTLLELIRLELIIQKAQTDGHKELLLDLLGIMVACKKHNQTEWMDSKEKVNEKTV